MLINVVSGEVDDERRRGDEGGVLDGEDKAGDAGGDKGDVVCGCADDGIACEADDGDVDEVDGVDGDDKSIIFANYIFKLITNK